MTEQEILKKYFKEVNAAVTSILEQEKLITEDKVRNFCTEKLKINVDLLNSNDSEKTIKYLEENFDDFFHFLNKQNEVLRNILIEGKEKGDFRLCKIDDVTQGFIIATSSFLSLPLLHHLSGNEEIDFETCKSQLLSVVNLTLQGLIKK